MNEEIMFVYNEEDFKSESDERRAKFELFIQDLIQECGYNPETDQIDVKTLFEKYVWRP